MRQSRFDPRGKLSACVRPLWLVAGLAGLAIASGSDSIAVVKDPATLQLEFGVKVALKGSWNEAAFRFERAIKLGGGGPHLYNNLAVAQESLGQFESARASYEKAIAMEKPGSEDPRIKENYERLINFLKSSHPAPAAP